MRSEFKKEYYNTPLRSVCEINQGPCEDFAEVIKEWIPAAKVTATAMALEGFPGALGRDMVLIDADEELVRYHGKRIHLPPHYWVVHQGRHYDAECPLGVTNWLELPLFKRVLKKARGRRS